MQGDSSVKHVSVTQLFKQLEEEPYRFDFFQAIRLIESALPENKKIGYGVKPQDDGIRLGQEPSLAFSPSSIASFDTKNSSGKPQLDVFFFGLFGPNGPLPLHLTEYARDRNRNFGDHSLTAFVNLFHHRLLSFFYRAWADAKPHVNLDRPRDDGFSRKVSNLIGLGGVTSSAAAVPDYAKYHLAGRFVAQSRNAEGLLAGIKNYFSLPAELKQFTGAWYDVPAQDRLRLKAAQQDTSLLPALGLNSTLGGRVWERQSKFTLSFGPLDFDGYTSLLPGGRRLAKLVDLVRSYIGDELSWDVQLVLKKDQVKPAELGRFGQLGWTTWIGETQNAGDFDGLYLDPHRDV